jgi:hypothetical protein
MQDFDIQISMNGVENELNNNLTEKVKYLSFDGESTDVQKEQKKSWTDTLNDLTKTFKDVTGYQTKEQAKLKKEKELAEKGIKYKVLGMNPFVAIGLSLVVIISGSIVLTKIKAN